MHGHPEKPQNSV